MDSSGQVPDLGAEIDAMAMWVEPPSRGSEIPPLSPEQCHQVRLVLDLVGLLAERHGFDPAELVSPRTGAPLGPALARMRDALQASDAECGRER
jgi:hypothetical protein